MPDELRFAAVENEEFPSMQSKVKNELDGLVGIKTKYNEDVLIGGHTAVWGSAFDKATKKWGYKCCLCFDKEVTRCLGIVGRNKVLKAREEAGLKAQKESEE